MLKKQKKITQQIKKSICFYKLKCFLIKFFSETIEKDEEAEKNRINALWEDFQSDTNTFASSSKNESVIYLIFII